MTVAHEERQPIFGNKIISYGEQPWQKAKALQNILDIKGNELKQKEMCIK